jgi:endoglucanase
LNYNGTIPAHGNYSGVGFTATYSGSNPPPTSFSVNGTACN